MTGKEKEVGEAWDALDVPGKKAVIDGGAEAISSRPRRTPRCARSAPRSSEAKVKELEGKGLPARAVYTRCARSPRSTPRPRRASGTDRRHEPREGGGRATVAARDDRWRGAAARFCGWLAAAFVAAMMLLTVADVVLRAVFNRPIRGTLEIVELLLACTFFLALPAVFLRDENLVVDVVDDVAPRCVPLLRRFAEVVAVVGARR